MLEHGGNLILAAQRYGRPLPRWIDLSTGVNPHGWPIPPIPAEYWQRLPENDKKSMAAAQARLGFPHALMVAGTQAAIQTIPLLRPPCRVAIPTLTYTEHAACWQREGHEVIPWTPYHSLDDIDVVILVNPNNPTGEVIPLHQLWHWHSQLATHGGWLIVDEAFMDATPENSLLHTLPHFAQASLPLGLIVLRSLGKFYGLAGARVGMVGASPCFLDLLAERLGPWPVSAPARWIAHQAWVDVPWQETMIKRLKRESERLHDLLARHGLPPRGGTALFQWVVHTQAHHLHESLAQQGLWTRLFQQAQGLRLGLPADEPSWQRLNEALSSLG